MGDEISMTSMPSCAKQMQAKGDGARGGEREGGGGGWVDVGNHFD